MEEVIKSFEAKLNDFKSGVASKEEIATLKSEFQSITEKLAKNEQIEGLIEKLDELALEVKALEQKGVSTDKPAITKEISEKKEALKGLLKGSKAEIEIKALTSRASITDNANAYQLPDIGQLGVKRNTLYDVLPKINIPVNGNDNGVIRYRDWDENTIARAAAAVEEGNPFPESTAAFIDRTLPIQKIGDTLPVTEEFFEDEALAAAELEMFLDVNVASEIGDQVVNGNGLSGNLKGLLTSVPVYTPLADSIPAANLKDLCRKMRTTIVKNRGSKYAPDIVVMNSEMFDKYYLSKDANKNYLFDENGLVAGLTVIEDNHLADNVIVVGDRRFARIYQKGGTVLSEGFVNGQFTEDAKTLKARKRLCMLIREVDKTGFLKCTDVADALTELSSLS